VTMTGPAHFSGRSRFTSASRQLETTDRSECKITTRISVNAQPWE
jgi:hypothetical protein